VEEAGHVDRHDGGEILRRVFDERLGDEDAGVVDQGVDAAEMLDGSESAISPATVTRSGLVLGLIERELATTRYPLARKPSTRPAPMPWDAPVMMATLRSVLMTACLSKD
jgi:hypothetical protein